MNAIPDQFGNGQTDSPGDKRVEEVDAREKLRSLSEKAIKTLEQVMDSRNPREARQAAETVLNRVGLSDKGVTQFPNTQIPSVVIISALHGIAQIYGQAQEQERDVPLIQPKQDQDSSQIES